MNFQQLIALVKSYCLSPYMKMCWFCVLGFFGCWLFAFILAQATLRRGGSTIVFKARQAWGIAFLIHLLAVLVVTALWWRENFPFQGFYYYLSAYIVLVIIDVVILAKMFAGLHGYRSFSR
jgi:hypothetical protein